MAEDGSASKRLTFGHARGRGTRPTECVRRGANGGDGLAPFYQKARHFVYRPFSVLKTLSSSLSSSLPVLIGRSPVAVNGGEASWSHPAKSEVIVARTVVTWLALYGPVVIL